MSPRRNEAIGCGIGECESHEGGLEDEHLGPKIDASIDELRQERHEERQALGVERGHQPGVAKHARGGGMRADGHGIARSTGTPELDAKPNKVEGACPLEDREQKRRCRQQRPKPKHGQRHGREVAERDADGNR